MIRTMCNECEKVIPHGHYTLTRDDTFVEFSEDDEPRHFCNITCLSNWATAKATA